MSVQHMRGDRHFLCAIVIEYESVYLRGGWSMRLMHLNAKKPHFAQAMTQTLLRRMDPSGQYVSQSAFFDRLGDVLIHANL